MKIVIRGAPCTGKTSLWRRFQGLAYSAKHTVTPEIQTASILWTADEAAGLGDEQVKVEVWDCVDKGTGLSAGINTRPPSHTPASNGVPSTGKHSFAPLDTSIVDVYKGEVSLWLYTTAHTITYKHKKHINTTHTLTHSLTHALTHSRIHALTHTHTHTLQRLPRSHLYNITL